MCRKLSRTVTKWIAVGVLVAASPCLAAPVTSTTIDRSPKPGALPFDSELPRPGFESNKDKPTSSLKWFDETNGGSGFDTFAELVKAYDSFTGIADQVITFEELTEGSILSDQYAGKYGVTFKNTAGDRHSYSGVRKEGGSLAENITGYDGSYMLDGSNVYARFDNDDSSAPFTIAFDKPVSTVGAFVGMGKQGSIHELQVLVYDIEGELLGKQTVESWLWDSNKSKQNYESFFAVMMEEAMISRVEILNLATTKFANGLLIDNVAWSSGVGVAPVPEPMTALFSAVGVAYLWTRPRRLR